MGSNDLPPSHLPSYYLPIADALLQVGGASWTICYILLTLTSFRTRSYGMPLFALANNFAWEFVYALFVAESTLEKSVFTIWLIIDLGMVAGLLKYGREEWSHAPFVKRNLAWIFWTLVAWCILAQWAFAHWWIENEIGKKEGKVYRNVTGPDTTELGYWSSAAAQTLLSVASLAQLLVRQHTGGVSWGIWGTRAFGSLVGLYMNYGWMWYFWREATEYFMSPFSLVLWVTALVCDMIYPFVFAQIRKTEKVLPDGRKFAGNGVQIDKKKA